MGFDPFGWVLHDGKAGMSSQAVGLAEAAGFAFLEKRLEIRFPWTCLPPLLWPAPLDAPGGAGARLEPPWPDFVIACGRNAAMPRPILAVLIGGSNKAYRLTLRRVQEIADGVAAILRERGGSALVTPSRRTGSQGLAMLQERLAGLPAKIWDGAGENPYFTYLAFADAFLVTADSVSMISEAAATGKPVHILDLDGGNAKFARFHQIMRNAGITRPFAGRIEEWSYPVPDDTARAGAALRALVSSRFDQRERA